MSEPRAGSGLGERDEWRRLEAFLWGRLGMCAAILTAIGLAAAIAGVEPRMGRVVAPVLAVMALTAPYRSWGRRHLEAFPAAYVWILAGDAVLTTIGAYYLGGENAVYGLPIYGIYVVMAAALLAWTGIFVVAAAAAAVYAAMALATGAGWIPEQPSAFVFRFTDAWPWMTVIVNGFAVFAIAFAAGSLGAVTRRAMERSRGLEERLRELNRGLERRVAEAVRGLRTANAALVGKNAEFERMMEQSELLARGRATSASSATWWRGPWSGVPAPSRPSTSEARRRSRRRAGVFPSTRPGSWSSCEATAGASDPWRTRSVRASARCSGG